MTKLTCREIIEKYGIPQQKRAPRDPSTVPEGKEAPKTHGGGDMLQWGYDIYYDKIFDHLREKEINYLEVGILEGLKLLCFSKFFENADIYGLDIDTSNFNRYPHDEEFLSRVKNITQLNSTLKSDTDKYKETLNVKFDVIVDDGDHTPSSMISTFVNMFDTLKDDGIYIIEDLTVPVPPYRPTGTRYKPVSEFLLSKNVKFELHVNPNVKDNPDKKGKSHGIIVIRKNENLEVNLN
jgi:hypothetical protein